jgi:RinA family phage transcriptional activator
VVGGSGPATYSRLFFKYRGGLNIKHELLKYIEAEIRDYHRTRAALEELRGDILDESPPPPDGMPKGSRVSNPTLNRTQRLLTCRQVQYYSRVLSALSIVLDNLPPEKYKLVKLTYWTQPQTLTPTGIAMKLNCGRNTFYRWRREICEAVARELGMWR